MRFHGMLAFAAAVMAQTPAKLDPTGNGSTIAPTRSRDKSKGHGGKLYEPKGRKHAVHVGGDPLPTMNRVSGLHVEMGPTRVRRLAVQLGTTPAEVRRGLSEGSGAVYAKLVAIGILK